MKEKDLSPLWMLLVFVGDRVDSVMLRAQRRYLGSIATSFVLRTKARVKFGKYREGGLPRAKQLMRILQVYQTLCSGVTPKTRGTA